MSVTAVSNSDKKKIVEFIEAIKDNKLCGFPTNRRGIYKTQDFRFDMQGMTSDKPPKHNLQVQVNNQTKSKTLEEIAPDSVAIFLVGSEDEDITPQEIRDGLIDSIKIKP